MAPPYSHDLRKRLLRPAVLLRVAADVGLIQIAIVTALLVRYIGVRVFENDSGTLDLGEIYERYWHIYRTHAIPLTLLCLATLGLSGVYTRRRLYIQRFKAIAVWNAVTLAFLFYGAVWYFVPAAETRIPRIALILAYAFTAVALVCARMFIFIWQRYANDEIERPRYSTAGELRDRILVVGGAGYIGSALVPQLLQEGHKVRVLDAMLFGEDPLEPVKHHPNLEIVRGDFRHAGVLTVALRHVSTVVHLAGIVGDPACNLDENLTIDVNLASTRHIADRAKEHGIERFVFASTCSVYGACDELLDEKSEAIPVSLYGRTKKISERILQELACDTFSPTILRFATIYGLSGRTRFDLVVNLLSAKAKVDGKITVFNGDQWRPFVHVLDAARAIRLAINAPREVVHNEIFNVGSNNQNHTILGVGQLIHQQVIGAELIVDSTQSDPRNYRIDFSKIRDELGFLAEWTVEEGIRQVLDAIASGKVADYRDPKYSNYEFLNLQGTADLARDRWAVEMVRDMEQV